MATWADTFYLGKDDRKLAKKIVALLNAAPQGGFVTASADVKATAAYALCQADALHKPDEMPVNEAIERLANEIVTLLADLPSECRLHFLDVCWEIHLHDTGQPNRYDWETGQWVNTGWIQTWQGPDETESEYHERIRRESNPWG